MKTKLVLVAAILALTFISLQGFAQTAPGMLPAFITAGNIDPNGKVPSINSVPGSAIENLGLAFPVTVLLHGTNYAYSVVLQDNNYTGNATVSYKLTQVQSGKTVTLDSGTIKTFATAPGNVWIWYATGKAIPNSPGGATLTGSVKVRHNDYINKDDSRYPVDTNWSKGRG